MPKIKHHKELRSHRNIWYFYCPGCENYHSICSDPGGWTFNGDVDKPTISPSLRTNTHSTGETECHLFVREGKIEFLNDCKHDLAGQTVEMQEIE